MQLRIRTVKPELFKHEKLFDLEKSTGLPIRFAWIGLFAICDREGRFNWRPRTIKAYVLPYDEADFALILETLLAAGMLVKYQVGEELYGCIPTFGKHQVINNRESDSTLPPPDADACPTREPRVDHAGKVEQNRREPKGTEEKPREHAPTTALIASPSGEGPVPALQGNLLLDAALVDVPRAIRQGWVDTYDPAWLKLNLLKCIEHHMGRAGASAPGEVKGWQKRLSNWLKTEREPKLRPKPVILRPRDPATPWPDGKADILGGFSALEAMRSLKGGA